jgi:hypothetical protein
LRARPANGLRTLWRSGCCTGVAWNGRERDGTIEIARKFHVEKNDVDLRIEQVREPVMRLKKLEHLLVAEDGFEPPTRIMILAPRSRKRVKGDVLDADHPGAPALRGSRERDDFRTAVERGGDPGGDAIGRHQQGRVGHVHVQLRGANFGVTD